MIIALYITTGCIPKAVPDYVKKCNGLPTLNNIHLKVKTRIVTINNKITLIQHIFIKNGNIRINTMGVFDDILMSIILKENNIFVIMYQQKIIYNFTNEEEFYRISGLYLPIHYLPLLLTFSDVSEKPHAEDNQNTSADPYRQDIRFIRDENMCYIKGIEITSPLSGDIYVQYSDFSYLNSTPVFHRLNIKNKKQKIEINMIVQRATKEDIRDDMFNTDIAGFTYVKK